MLKKSENRFAMNVRRALSVTRNAGRDQVLLTSEKDLIYVAGRNVVWHNYARDRVRVLPQTPRTTRQSHQVLSRWHRSACSKGSLNRIHIREWLRAVDDTAATRGW